MYTETAVRSLPLPFAIQSLSDFATGLPDELLICPVRALSEFVNRPRRLFVSSCSFSRAMSNNGFSYLLRVVIVHSGASSNDIAAPNGHSIRGIATSSAFFRNWSLASVLEVPSWRSNTVFTSFCLTASLHGRSMSEVLGNDCSIGGLMLFLRNTGFYHKF